MKRFDLESKRIFTEDEYVNYYLAQLPNEDLLKAQFNELPIVFDSESETLRHIKRVNELLGKAAIELINRAAKHDDSKLGAIEKPYFDVIPFKLKRNCPEHYANDEMNLIEMYFDRVAAGERHTVDSIEKSIEANKGRFNMRSRLLIFLLTRLIFLKETNNEPNFI